MSLKCVIRQSVRDPDYIFWYQNNKRVLDYGKGAKVISSERLDANTMVATLTINNAVLHDSGNYTCQPSNLDSASAYLHVLNGTQQHNTIIMTTRYDCLNRLLFFVFFYLLNLLWISSGNPAAVNRFLGGLRFVFGNSYVKSTFGGGGGFVARNPGGQPSGS